MTEQELMYASEEDIKFFHKCTEGLPSVAGFSGTGHDANGDRIPYGCGPHSVRCLRAISEHVKPKSILEIGFNLGYSSAMWLELNPEASIIGVDISDKKETLRAEEIMINRYNTKEWPLRFMFLHHDSSKLIGSSAWDYLVEANANLIFIDGGHELRHVVADIELALALKIKWLAFDDILERFGPGVLPAIELFPQLKEVMTLGNIALYENLTWYGR